MDELEVVRQLLAERPPPTAGVVAAARASLERAVAPGNRLTPLHLNGGRPVLGSRPAAGRHRWRRWQAWLAPVAAAAAVAAVIAVSVAISSTVGSQARRPATSTPAVFAQVPPYFVALTGHAVPNQGERAEVVATATGAVLGSVTVPKRHSVFTEVAAAGDDRTFVLAVQHGMAVSYVGGGHKPLMYNGVGPATFYRLVLTRSGRPAALTALPVPPVAGNLNGFALSPDGSKLAVSVLPSTPLRSERAATARGSRLLVFTVATGAQRTWTLPGTGWIGMNKPNAASLSWAGDNRTLLFQDQPGTGGGTTQVRLLDTATPGGSVLAASRPVPFSAKQLSGIGGGFMILSADGTKIFTATTRYITHDGMTPQQRRPRQVPRQCWPRALQKAHYENLYCQKLLRELVRRVVQSQAEQIKHGVSTRTYAAYTEFSVRTGKPVLVLGHSYGQGQTGADVNWASATGTAMIVEGPGPHSASDHSQLALGVLAGGTFTPLPEAVQAFLYSATW